jgi:hypothetical protein
MHNIRPLLFLQKRINYSFSATRSTSLPTPPEERTTTPPSNR